MANCEALDYLGLTSMPGANPTQAKQPARE